MHTQTGCIGRQASAWTDVARRRTSVARSRRTASSNYVGASLGRSWGPMKPCRFQPVRKSQVAGGSTPRSLAGSAGGSTDGAKLHPVNERAGEHGSHSRALGTCFLQLIDTTRAHVALRVAFAAFARDSDHPPELFLAAPPVHRPTSVGGPPLSSWWADLPEADVP